MSQSLMGQFPMSKRTARGLLGVAAGLRVSGTALRSTGELRGRPGAGDILAAAAVSSMGTRTEPSQGSNTGSNPVTATPNAVPGDAARSTPLGLWRRSPPSSNGQDTTLSRWEQGFDSPWGHECSGASLMTPLTLHVAGGLMIFRPARR